MLHTGRAEGQSVLLLQGSAVQVPTVPSVLVQYSPRPQLVTPPSRRQPVAHTPVLAVEVSQKLSALQSVSLVQPQVAVDGMHTGVAGWVAQALLLRAEHRAHWPARVDPVGWHAGDAAVGQDKGPGFLAA